MIQHDERFEAEEWQSAQASVDQLRVENWLKIAEVLHWSPMFRSPTPIRFALGLASGIIFGIWLDAKYFGTSSWIFAGALFVAILALLTITKSAISKWIQKMTLEVGGASASPVTAREAMAFAGEALTYCRGRGSVPSGTTLENFRRTCRARRGGSANPILWLTVTTQAVALASFGLGGLLSKLAPVTSPIVQQRVIQPVRNETDDSALHLPLKEMPVEDSPIPIPPPIVAKTEAPSTIARDGWSDPEKVEREIKRLSQELVQLENKGELEPLLALYGPTVDYFGTSKDVDAIRREKEADFKKWVKRNYQITSEPTVKALSGGKWQTTFSQTFECENTAGDLSSGKVASTLVFENIDGSLRIIGQIGPVSDSKKIAKFQPAATPSVPLPGPVAEGPEPTEELSPPVPEESQAPRLGVIYKVPDLKNLVSRRMDNKWLYGEFCLTGWKGNIVYCSTFARGIRLREKGSTTLEIEFSGGLQLDAVVSGELDNNSQLTFKIASTNPIQLLSVTRDHDGRIHVRARTKAQLTRRDLSY